MTTPIEDPVRLEAFLKETSTLAWGPEERLQSLDKVFLAVNRLAQAEVTYYYMRRKRSKMLSIGARLIAWICGTAGLLAPLIEPVVGASTVEWSKWGYVLLALAASALAGNALFDGSEGHMRNVRTQIDIERAVTLFRLEWYSAKAEMAPQPSPDQTKAAFASLRSFIASIYGALGAETNRWVSAMQQANARYEAQLSHHRTAPKLESADKAPQLELATSNES